MFFERGDDSLDDKGQKRHFDPANWGFRQRGLDPDEDFGIGFIEMGDVGGGGHGLGHVPGR